MKQLNTIKVFFKQEILYILDRLHWFKTKHFNLPMWKLEYLILKQRIKKLLYLTN